MTTSRPIPSATIRAPSLALLGMEPMRAVMDYAFCQLTSFASMPVGDGHPVLVFPGLGTSEVAVAPMTAFLRARGYATYDWGGGLNIGPQGDFYTWLEPLAARIAMLHARHRAKVSLIGWSLGGVYARELAKRLRPKVRQVITLGTPCVVDCRSTSAGNLYEVLHGQGVAFTSKLIRRLRVNPTVPTTSVYSRTDGVVAWESCILERAAHLQSIEVDAGHFGLVVSAAVFGILADRLSQPARRWKPYALHWPEPCQLDGGGSRGTG